MAAKRSNAKSTGPVKKSPGKKASKPAAKKAAKKASKPAAKKASKPAAKKSPKRRQWHVGYSLRSVSTGFTEAALSVLHTTT
ncbi:MAG: hypothetical protein KC492_23145, partial [Myxococcales bacterium]|nr:hypothetical protein [Myxococcales bacterium]